MEGGVGGTVTGGCSVSGGRVTTTTERCVVSRGGSMVITCGVGCTTGPCKSSVIIGCGCVVCSTGCVGIVTAGGGKRVVLCSLSSGCLGGIAVVCGGVASPSSMVTTMWGVCAVVASTAGEGDS